MIFIRILICCLLATSTLYAQNLPTSTGARSFGLGNTSTTLSDPFSVFNNISGISEVKNKSVFIAYDNRFGILELQSVSSGYIHPVSFGTFGISFFRFGDELFNQQVLGIGYADKIGIISLGGKINYYQTNIEGFGSKGGIILEFGAQAQILPELSFGTRLFNLNQAELVSNDRFTEVLPTVIEVGIAYQPIDDLKLNIQIDKDVDREVNFKAGIELNIIEEVVIRTGFNTQPMTSFFGVGFKKKTFVIDYSTRINSNLGLSHHASVSYEFIPKKK